MKRIVTKEQKAEQARNNKATRAAYYQKHKGENVDRDRENRRKWIANNPERVKAYSATVRAKLHLVRDTTRNERRASLRDMFNFYWQSAEFAQATFRKTTAL